MKINCLVLFAVFLGLLVDNLAGKYLLVDVDEVPQNKIEGIFLGYTNNLCYTL